MPSPGGYPGEDFDSLAELTYSRALRAGDYLRHHAAHREISDILDMKESTVKSRLYRGRKQIAEMYGYKVKEGRA